MRDCKIILIGYDTGVRAAAQIVKKQYNFSVIDHPAVEQEINRYLSQGYRIVNCFQHDGLWFVLEREG